MSDFYTKMNKFACAVIMARDMVSTARDEYHRQMRDSLPRNVTLQQLRIVHGIYLRMIEEAVYLSQEAVD